MRACKQLAPIQLDPGHYSHELQDDDGFGVSALETEKPSSCCTGKFLHTLETRTGAETPKGMQSVSDKCCCCMPLLPSWTFEIIGMWFAIERPTAPPPLSPSPACPPLGYIRVFQQRRLSQSSRQSSSFLRMRDVMYGLLHVLDRNDS